MFRGVYFLITVFELKTVFGLIGNVSCIISNGHCEKSVHHQIARLVPCSNTFMIIVHWQALEREGTKSFTVHESKSDAIWNGTT